MFKTTRLAAPLAALALAISPAPAVAQAEALFGAVVGAMIGAATQQPRVVVRPSGTSGASSAQREANRLMQTHLNYFGFNAGVADGVVGNNTRIAISGFQAYIGMAADGTITQLQRDILSVAHARATAPDATTQRLISRSPDGVRAVLIDQKQIALGASGPVRSAGYLGVPPEVAEAIDEIADSSDPSAEQLLQRSGFIQLADLNGDGNTDYILDSAASGSAFWCGTDRCKVLVFVSTPSGYARNDVLLSEPTPASFRCIGSSCVLAQPETTMASAEPTAPVQDTLPKVVEASTGGLPLLVPEVRAPSLSSHCSKVALLTSSNGGFATVAATGDPMLVLTEQFCVARGYAIDASERIIQTLAGISTAQIEQQCKVYGTALAEHVATLGSQPRAQVLRNVGKFILDSNAGTEQLTATAEICLGTGYRIDDMAVAQGTALLLVALGKPAHGELLGHHLAHGFGSPEAPERAVEWYRAALDALAAGEPAVFASGLTERPAILRAAVTGIDPNAPSSTPTKASASLPTFNVVKE